MRSSLPAGQKIDYAKYLDEYLKQPDAMTHLPSEEELLKLAHDSIVREQLVLLPVADGECAAEGDTVTLRTSGDIPKFNKDKVSATLGRGLYSKELELLIIGHRRGDIISADIQSGHVRAEILDIRRKQTPEPCDEMVAALQVKDNEGNLITTVSAYEAYIREEKTTEVLATVNYYVMEKILSELPENSCDEDDIRVLGELEREYFIKLFLEQEHMDLRETVPEDWKKENINTLDDFIALRRDWYKIKIRQCLIYLNILNLKCEGKTDPLDHYEVLQELMQKMFDYIKDEFKRREKL